MPSEDIPLMLGRLIFRERLRMESRLDGLQNLPSHESPLDDESLQLPLMERIFFPVLRAFGQRFQKLAPSAMKGSLARRLGQAGIRVSADQYTGWFILSACAGAALGSIFGFLGGKSLPVTVFMAFLMGGTGVLLPELILRQRVRKRQADIVRALPDVLDLLTVSVKAGLGFDSSLQKVTEKMKGALPQEMGQVLHEIKMGVVRKEALRSLSERTGVGALQAFVGTIIQADQLGGKHKQRTSASVRVLAGETPSGGGGTSYEGPRKDAVSVGYLRLSHIVYRASGPSCDSDHRRNDVLGASRQALGVRLETLDFRLQALGRAGMSPRCILRAKNQELRTVPPITRHQ